MSHLATLLLGLYKDEQYKFSKQTSFSTPQIDLYRFPLKGDVGGTHEREFGQVYDVDYFWKPDGTQFFIHCIFSGTNVTDYVYQFQVPNAWNLASAVYTKQRSALDGVGMGGAWQTYGTDAGKRFWGYVTRRDTGVQQVKRFNMPNAWDVGNTSQSQNVNLSGFLADGFAGGAATTDYVITSVNVDQNKLWITTFGPGIVVLMNQFTLTNNWSMTGMTFDGAYSLPRPGGPGFSSSGYKRQNFKFNSDFTKLYMIQTAPRIIYTMDLDGGKDFSTFDVSDDTLWNQVSNVTAHSSVSTSSTSSAFAARLCSRDLELLASLAFLSDKLYTSRWI